MVSKNETNKKLRRGVQGTGGKVGEIEGNESSGSGAGDTRGNAKRVGTQGEKRVYGFGSW